MPLFDPNVEQSDDAIKPGESDYEWFSRTTSARSARYREWLEEQFGRLPASCQRDLCARFRNKRPEQHFGAAFEIFLFGMFRSIGYQVTVPEYKPGASRLDLLLSLDDKPLAHVEATVVEVDPEANAMARRLYDLLEAAEAHVSNKAFAVRIRRYTCGQQATAVRDFARTVDKWFGQVSSEGLAELVEQDRRPTLRFEDTSREWRIDMEIWARRRDSSRLWRGISSTRQPATAERVRAAVAAKLKQHQDAIRAGALPYVVAVASRDEVKRFEDDDMNVILAGTPGCRFWIDGRKDEPFVKEDGVWTRPTRDGGPRTHPAAVIAVSDCFGSGIGRLDMSLWDNPHVPSETGLPTWPFRRCGWPAPAYTFVQSDGEKPLERLGITEDPASNGE